MSYLHALLIIVSVAAFLFGAVVAASYLALPEKRCREIGAGVGTFLFFVGLAVVSGAYLLQQFTLIF